jgi:hypothetical protein
MSSADIDELYEELLKIYKDRYISPKKILSYKIIELMKEGRSRENAILALYETEGKITPAEAEVLEEEARKKKQTLEAEIRKKKEEAIEQQIKKHKKSLEKLALLFSKGELDEESYRAAIKLHEEKTAKLETEKKEEATVKHKRESIELPAPPPTAPTKRLDFQTISKYFIHGFAFSIIMLALGFVWVFVLVFLTVAGSLIGLILGFVVLLFILSGLNSFLLESIWSISTEQEWVSLLFHGFWLFVAFFAAHIPAIIINYFVPSLAITIILFIIYTFIDGFVAKNVASWWEEEY